MNIPAKLKDPERNITLSLDEIGHLNPNTKTAPVFRSRADAVLTAKAHSVSSALSAQVAGAHGNSCQVEFRQGLFSMTSDSDQFITAVQLTELGCRREGSNWIADGVRYVPLYETKMLPFYDHRSSGYGSRGDDRGYRVLPETTLEEHRDPAFEPEPFYWVTESEVLIRLQQKKIQEKLAIRLS